MVGKKRGVGAQNKKRKKTKNSYSNYPQVFGGGRRGEKMDSFSTLGVYKKG